MDPFVNGVSLRIDGAPLKDVVRRFDMLRREIEGGANAAQTYADAPLASNHEPFRFVGAMSVPLLCDVRFAANADNVLDLEFAAATSSTGGWVHTEMLDMGRRAHGLQPPCDVAPSDLVALAASTVPEEVHAAEEMVWLLLCSIGSALTLFHGCGLSLGGNTTPDCILRNAAATLPHESHFVVRLPEALNLSRAGLLEQQRADIAGLAASARWLLQLNGTEAYSPELLFLLSKMESPTCPTASQLVGFQAVKLRCETWMLKRSIANGCNHSPSAPAVQSVLQTPPLTPVPNRSRSVQSTPSPSGHQQQVSFGGESSTSTTVRSIVDASTPTNQSAESIEDDDDEEECELIEMTEEVDVDDIQFHQSPSPQQPQQHKADLLVAHTPSSSIAATPKDKGSAAMTPLDQNSTNRSRSSTSRQRSPRSCSRRQAEREEWYGSRLDDLSTMQEELSKITRTPTRDRVAATEILNHLRARTKLSDE